MLKPTEPKKVLCIHDLSGVGRCSLAVILPVLSVMGVQPVALPTVVLSTHTGGFGTPARMDGAAYGMAALEHYHDLGLDFACIYTGYLGGEEQIALAEKAFDLWPAARKIVDPVMGDNGHAYSTVTPAFIDRMRELARRADLILPNATEAVLLLQKNATVTVCHSRTKNLPELLKTADVIVAAVGKPCFVKPEMVKEGVVIVDVGINAVGDKLVGDVDPAVAAKASAFTPVPGGIGVVSNMMVMECLTRNL